MRTRDLIFAAPTRSAGSFAQADKSLVGVDFDQQEGRDGVRAAASTADGELRFDRHPQRDGFKASNLQAMKTALPFSKFVHKAGDLGDDPAQETFAFFRAGQLRVADGAGG